MGVSYFASPLPLDPNRVGDWSVDAAFLDLAAPDPSPARTVVDAHVHQGGICVQGTRCEPYGEDRALLDFFESATLPDGRMVIAYPADPLLGGKAVQIRFAVQDSGDRL